MKEWTQGNHLKYGYSEWFDNPLSSEDLFKIKYGSVADIGSRSWREECIHAAKLIRKSTSKPICILMSGGLDAELAACSFLEAGIVFEAATLEYKSPYRNTYETDEAREFCRAHNIKHTIYEMDLEDFLANKAIEFAKNIRVFEGFRATKLWLVDEMVRKGFYPVVGQGEMLMVKGSALAQKYKHKVFDIVQKYKNDNWYFVENEAVFAWNKHFSQNDIDGCPCFFQYTPEQMYSYLKEDSTLNLVGNKTAHTTNENYKFEQYSLAFDLIKNRRNAYSGFEKYFKIKFKLNEQYHVMADIYGFKRRTSIYLFEYSEILSLLASKNTKIARMDRC